MKAKAVPFTEIIELGKWRADLHVHADSEIRSEKYRLVKLSDLVIESKLAINPNELETGVFYYIGLENVETITGDPQGISLLTSDQVRSRSKKFELGDILFGKLRPYLRKALYVEAPYTKGLCSSEFIVLKVRTEYILPLFLREILVSDSVTEIVKRFQAGAALPRISSKDLLSVSIPVPSLEFQEECVSKIEYSRRLRSELLQKINTLSQEGQRVISDIFS